MNRSAMLADEAIDLYLKKSGSTLHGVTAQTLASLVGVSMRVMSQALQDHRVAQSKGRTLYYLKSMGYGHLAMWKITGKPGDDPVIIQKARTDAVVELAEDNAKRFAKSVRCDLLPASVKHGTPEDMDAQQALEDYSLRRKLDDDLLIKRMETIAQRHRAATATP